MTTDVLDSANIELIHMPGHTAGSIILYLPSDGLILAGDSAVGPGPDQPVSPASLQRPGLGQKDKEQFCQRWHEIVKEKDVRGILPLHGLGFLESKLGKLEFERTVENIWAGDPMDPMQRSSRLTNFERVKTMKAAFDCTGKFTLRVAFGGMMLVHGWQKLSGYSEIADKFPNPLGMGSQASLISAIGAEVGCAILLIAGLLTRVASLPLAFTMIIALFVVHGGDPWQKKELAAVYLAAFVVIFFLGAGRFSLDHLIWSKKDTPADVDEWN